MEPGLAGWRRAVASAFARGCCLSERPGARWGPRPRRRFCSAACARTSCVPTRLPARGCPMALVRAPKGGQWPRYGRTGRSRGLFDLRPVAVRIGSVRMAGAWLPTCRHVRGRSARDAGWTARGLTISEPGLPRGDREGAKIPLAPAGKRAHARVLHAPCSQCSRLTHRACGWLNGPQATER
jgi:hypothetical protein